MGIRIPKTLKNFNLHLNGTSYAGIVKQCKLPDVTVKTEDHQAGGMDLPRKIDMGMEALECTFTLSQFDAEAQKTVAIHNGSNTRLIIYGSINDDESSATVPVQATILGAVHKVEFSEFEAGKMTEDKYQVDCKFFELLVGGAEIFHIDNDNLIRRVDGTDQLESIRADISI